MRQTYEELYELEPNKIIDLVCSYDGSWHKRGHTSLYGIGCVIEVTTGLVVDYEILSKYCHMCVNTANDLEEELCNKLLNFVYVMRVTKNLSTVKIMKVPLILWKLLLLLLCGKDP